MTSILIGIIAVMTVFTLCGVSVGQIEDKLSQVPEAGKQFIESIGKKAGGQQAAASMANPLSVKREDEKAISAAEMVRVPCEDCTATEELNNYYTDLR